MPWEQPDLATIRRRYRWVARVYPFFNIVFALPPGVRRRAVDRLGLPPGGSAAELGCGTGLNLPLLSGADGPSGRVFGVEATREMLDRARGRCDRRGLGNCELALGDAATAELPTPLDGALFSLSYSVMPRPQDALRRAWGALRTGGRLVVLDGGVPVGQERSLGARCSAALSRASVLGDPFRKPWEDMEALGATPDVETALFGFYFIASAVKRS